ncbi:23S rRNA pseudouridine(2604) synthase RluF [Oceanospirillum sanctuarii]|uniref:23S rRNA pseudouridine(2604) synthase RluF n=1 Tax=Oceanospirillum sanctuarii TaxID=1434821 RepID=UPI000A36AB9A|nr:23S rRNA pseudouridine(2604) synthase RluF [Oceanospirillum sanctuarii]
MLPNTTTRLNKYISESGICSRRDADRFIEQGNVYINGKRAQVGDRVSHGDIVKVNGQLIEPPEHDDFIFIALNKPVGIVSTTEGSEKDNIVDYVGHSHRIFPIGRLDKDSQGLIFLTNNGDLVNKVLRAGNNHEKEYLVTVNRPISDEAVEGLANGVPILGTMTKKCPVVKEGPNQIRMTLVQGLNRQIRRMCEYFGYEVVKLERVRIMNVSLKGLALGDWRDLTEQELTELLKAVEDSSSEAPEGRRSQGAKNSRNSNAGGKGNNRGGKSSSGGQNAGGAGNNKRPVRGQQSGVRSDNRAEGAGRNKAGAAGKPHRASVKPTTGKGAVKGGKLSGKVAARAAAAAAKGKGKGAVKASGKSAGKTGAGKGAAPKGRKPARRG